MGDICSHGLLVHCRSVVCCRSLLYRLRWEPLVRLLCFFKLLGITAAIPRLGIHTLFLDILERWGCNPGVGHSKSLRLDTSLRDVSRCYTVQAGHLRETHIQVL